jgi:hypothetical protein
MTGIVALAVLTAMGVAGYLAAVRVTRRRGDPSTPRAFDRELTSLMDRATAELLGERLAAGPLLVPVRMGHRLLGPFLVVDLGSVGLRLQLYSEHRRPPSPTGPGDDLARLRAVDYRDGEGWWFVFDGPLGPQHYLGWLVETVRRGVTAPV